jgi:hypothetical protein
MTGLGSQAEGCRYESIRTHHDATSIFKHQWAKAMAIASTLDSQQAVKFCGVNFRLVLELSCYIRNGMEVWLMQIEYLSMLSLLSKLLV